MASYTNAHHVAALPKSTKQGLYITMEGKFSIAAAHMDENKEAA
jgi:hypothetical protein